MMDGNRPKSADGICMQSGKDSGDRPLRGPRYERADGMKAGEPTYSKPCNPHR